MSGGVVIALGLVAVLLIAAFVYWQLVVAEGAYLGTRVVALLYDWFAPRYDSVKQYDKKTDALMLAMPVMQHLTANAPAVPTAPTAPRTPGGPRGITGSVLDVGSGTGRLPDALFAQPRFRGRVTAVDASQKMLNLARQKLGAYGERITFLQHDAQSLPFDEAQFDAVTCLEALEFMRDWRLAVREMIRVLKPGGLLMISNRIGPDAWKLPGRATHTGEFVEWLREVGIADANSYAWLVDYDLIIGTKKRSSST